MTSAGGILTTPRLGSLVAGVAGGLVGGVAFGMLMQMMGMMPMVAMLVRSESVVVGWLVHLVIAAAIGASFAATFSAWAGSLGIATALGAAYGALWWVLGALGAMPAILGMPTFNVDTTAMQSLVGHLIYGGLLGATYALLRARAM